MIIIAGYARTGTSILFKCLEKSGFYGGTEDQLFGHYYKSQHEEFGDINKQILIWAKQRNLTVPLRKWQVPEQIFPVINELGTEMEEQGINIVKDPNAAPVMQLWIDVVPIFKNPKFIRINRDVMDAAKSCIRLWKQQDWIKQLNRKRLTVKDVMERIKFENHLWDLTVEPYQTIKIQYDDLFSKNGTRDKISEFIGRDFDMSLIDPQKTFKASRKIY